MISRSAQTTELLTHPITQQVIIFELIWKGCYARSLIFMAVIICSINFINSSSIPITNLKNHGQCVELPSIRPPSSSVFRKLLCRSLFSFILLSSTLLSTSTFPGPCLHLFLFYLGSSMGHTGPFSS